MSCGFLRAIIRFVDLQSGGMKTEAISELLQPYLGEKVLSTAQLQSLAEYLELLLHWNAKINLTAIRQPDEIVRRHFGESLFAARHLLSEGDAAEISAIDIGSGAGFPGLPMKIAASGLKLILTESNHKKATFLSEAVRTLRLTDVKVSVTRAEELMVRADLVTLRAVERFSRILPVARRLMSAGGRLALLIGDSQAGMAQSALPELLWEDPVPIPLSNNRVLLVGRSI